MDLFNPKGAKLDKLEAAKILENIFEECDKEPNTVPIDELESYSNYRKESFNLQIGILKAALVCFIFLPLLFINPNFKVKLNMEGERGLPEYQIDISTMLPIKSVTAKMNGYSLPVYEVNGHSYTIEPTSNGDVKITVELINGQRKSEKIAVLEADAESPKLKKMNVLENECTIYIEDDVSGVDYQSVYAVTSDGETIYPDSYIRSMGYIVFLKNMEGADVYIPDNFKNVLHLKL